MKKALYTKKAVKGLRKMQQAQAVKMMQALSEIAQGNEQGKDTKRLVGTEGYRLRRGDYRALYHYTKDGIVVLTVGPRGDVYK